MAIWVLDASHGGDDSGIIGNELGRKESEIVLEAVLEMKKVLEFYGEKVILIRSNDEEISLEERVKRIKYSKGNYFVNLNMNSSIDNSIEGVQIFYLKEDGKCNKLAAIIEKEMVMNLVNKSDGIFLEKSDIYDDINLTTVLIYGDYLSNCNVERNFDSRKYGTTVAKGCLKMINKDLFIKK